MLLMMRSKRACRTAAIKCVDHALTRHAGACERFVDALGLKTAFAAFMGKGLEKTRKTRGADAAEEEERGISVVASLFANLERGSPRYDRLCAKFVEDEFAKCDRLAELWAAYAARVAAVDARLARRSEDFRLTEEDVYGNASAGDYTPWSSLDSSSDPSSRRGTRASDGDCCCRWSCKAPTSTTPATRVQTRAAATTTPRSSSDV